MLSTTGGTLSLPRGNLRGGRSYRDRCVNRRARYVDDKPRRAERERIASAIVEPQSIPLATSPVTLNQRPRTPMTRSSPQRRCSIEPNVALG
jgi:hypothetical protein